MTTPTFTVQRVSLSGVSFWLYSGDVPVARIHMNRPGERKIDSDLKRVADLIVAAPRLLEALKIMVDGVDNLNIPDTEPFHKLIAGLESEEDPAAHENCPLKIAVNPIETATHSPGFACGVTGGHCEPSNSCRAWRSDWVIKASRALKHEEND